MQYYNPVKVEASKAVSLEEAKEQLNILPSETTDDAFITKLIDRATMIASRFIEKDINETDNTVQVEGSEIIYLQDGYIKSITDPVTGFNAEFWPDFTKVTYDTAPEGTQTIEYKTGWLAADLPEDIRQAILLKIGELYDVDRNNSTMNNIKSTEQFEWILRYHKKLMLRPA